MALNEILGILKLLLLFLDEELIVGGTRVEVRIIIVIRVVIVVMVIVVVVHD